MGIFLIKKKDGETTKSRVKKKASATRQDSARIFRSSDWLIGGTAVGDWSARIGLRQEVLFTFFFFFFFFFWGTRLICTYSRGLADYERRAIDDRSTFGSSPWPERERERGRERRGRDNHR